jgi:hypothetical protein
MWDVLILKEMDFILLTRQLLLMNPQLYPPKSLQLHQRMLLVKLDKKGAVASAVIALVTPFLRLVVDVKLVQIIQLHLLQLLLRNVCFALLENKLWTENVLIVSKTHSMPNLVVDVKIALNIINLSLLLLLAFSCVVLVTCLLAPTEINVDLVDQTHIILMVWSVCHVRLVAKQLLQQHLVLLVLLELHFSVAIADLVQGTLIQIVKVLLLVPAVQVILLLHPLVLQCVSLALLVLLWTLKKVSVNHARHLLMAVAPLEYARHAQILKSLPRVRQ